MNPKITEILEGLALLHYGNFTSEQKAERYAQATKDIAALMVQERIDEHNLILDKELDLSEEAFFAWVDKHYAGLQNQLKRLRKGQDNG